MTKTKMHEQVRSIEVKDESGDAVSLVVKALLSRQDARRAYERGAGIANNDRAEQKGHYKELGEMGKPELSEEEAISEDIDFKSWEDQLAGANGGKQPEDEESGESMTEYRSDTFHDTGDEGIVLGEEDGTTQEDWLDEGKNHTTGQYRHRKHQEAEATLDDQQLDDLYN
jgi:hypothetical protein